MLWSLFLLLQGSSAPIATQNADVCSALWAAKAQLASNEKSLQDLSTKLMRERYFASDTAPVRTSDARKLIELREMAVNDTSGELGRVQGSNKFAREKAERQYLALCN